MIETKCWSFNGELIVAWNGVLLVYPDFHGTNTLNGSGLGQATIISGFGWCK